MRHSLSSHAKQKQSISFFFISHGNTSLYSSLGSTFTLSFQWHMHAHNNQPHLSLFFTRKNQQPSPFNPLLMAPIFIPIYFTSFACSHAANNSYKTPSSSPLSLTQAPEKEHPISSPPSIRWAPLLSFYPWLQLQIPLILLQQNGTT